MLRITKIPHYIKFLPMHNLVLAGILGPGLVTSNMELRTVAVMELRTVIGEVVIGVVVIGVVMELSPVIE
jgi:hypothetical protein